MKKALFIIIALNAILNVRSQTWCPPGAQWHYRVFHPIYADYRDGYVQLNNTGTVTVNNIICNHLLGSYNGILGWQFSPPISIPNFVDLKTYENNNVVYIYNTSINSFDTLANFSASPGDKWQKIEFPNPPPSSGCTFPRPKVTVIDTGHVTINSQYLKKLIVSHPYGNSTFIITDTIIEKIACITTFLFPYYHCINDGPLYGNFVCYSDNNFTLYKKAGIITPCNYFTVGINDHKSIWNEIKVFPNPVADQLNLSYDEYNFNITQIKITDPLGRIILEDVSTKLINIKELKPGIYFLQIYNKENLIALEKIIKE